jgi:hypothetical protein
MKRVVRSALALSLSIGLSACATSKAKTGYHFTPQTRVLVSAFDGDGGTSVTQEFIRQLLAAGFTVTDKAQSADVVLSGSVTDYHASDKMLIFLGAAVFPGPKGQSLDVDNPIISGHSSTSDTTALTLPKTQLVVASASIGLSATVKDLKTGDLLWANSYSYEGLTMESTIQIVVNTLVRSIRRLVVAAPAVAGHA